MIKERELKDREDKTWFERIVEIVFNPQNFFGFVFLIVMIALVLVMFSSPSVISVAKGSVVRITNEGFNVNISEIIEGDLIKIVNPVIVQDGVCSKDFHYQKCDIGRTVELTLFQNVYGKYWVITALL
jgi:hypothetical protein